MSNKRKSITENNKIYLYNEVNGICPICLDQLMYDKKNHKKQKIFEIAHIYPLNATEHEEGLLKNVEKINEDLDHIDNLICLCVKCHTKFDNPRTVVEYDKMLLCKKDLLIKNIEKNNWFDNKIEKELIDVIHIMSENEYTDIDLDIIQYNPKTIDKKTNDSITHLVKRKIHYNVENYYHIIKNEFKKIDTINLNTTELISTQIKMYYLSLVKNNTDQKIIFNSTVEWLHIKSKKQSREASEIIVSYFIQNCEIF